MITNGTLDASRMDLLEEAAPNWAHGTEVTVSSIKLDGQTYDVLCDCKCLIQVRERLLGLIEKTRHVQWTFLTDGSDSFNDKLVSDCWRALSWSCGGVIVLPKNFKVVRIGVSSDQAGASLLQKLRDEPGRTAKMAADLLVEIVRQKAREDVTDKAISGLSQADFAKLVGEVAADLVKERALK